LELEKNGLEEEKYELELEKDELEEENKELKRTNKRLRFRLKHAHCECPHAKQCVQPPPQENNPKKQCIQVILSMGKSELDEVEKALTQRRSNILAESLHVAIPSSPAPSSSETQVKYFLFLFLFSSLFLCRLLFLLQSNFLIVTLSANVLIIKIFVILT